jgi:hypothetical protein
MPIVELLSALSPRFRDGRVLFLDQVRGADRGLGVKRRAVALPSADLAG